MDENMSLIIIENSSPSVQTHPTTQSPTPEIDTEQRSTRNDRSNLNSRLYAENDENIPHCMIVLSTVVAIPQIVIAAVALACKWQTFELSSSLCFRIQLWVLVHCIRVSMSLVFEWTIYWAQNTQCIRFRNYHDLHAKLVKAIRFTLSLMELYWALMGNVWIFFSAGSTESDAHRCGDGSTTLYSAGFWLLIIPYVCELIPFLYCLVSYGILQLTGWDLDEYVEQLTSAKLERGAKREIIDQLTLRIFVPTNSAYDTSCCICLCDFELKEKIRLLPCNHHFHSGCIDEWLGLNATCPTCRISIDESSLSEQKKIGSMS